jgi:hypothetical protein
LTLSFWHEDKKMTAITATLNKAVILFMVNYLFS